MTDRELAMSGALGRAVGMLRRGYSQQRVHERILEVWPGTDSPQAWRIVALAQRGIDYADRINWQAMGVKVDLSGAPQLPEE